MKYSKEIIIDLPIEEVISKMEDHENFKHWQKGFISYQHLSGSPGQENARSKLKYKMGKRDIETQQLHRPLQPYSSPPTPCPTLPSPRTCHPDYFKAPIMS